MPHRSRYRDPLPVPPVPHRPSRAGVVLPVPVDPDGVLGPTRRQARGGRWRRSSRGLYVPAEVDADDLDQRIVEAAAVIPPGGGAVTGWAALAWRGGRWFSGRTADGTALPVQLAMWDDIRPQPGFTICHEGIDPREVEMVDGLPVTRADRTVCFLMRYSRHLIEAVRHADMAAYDDLVSLGELADYAFSHSGWTGIPLCRDAVLLADENAWSPGEVAPRIIWVKYAELPRPLTNVPIFDRGGRHVATPDLLDAPSGLAIEYDGEVHLEARQRRLDRDRLERLEAVGIRIMTVLAGDVGEPEQLAARMREARSRAPWQPPSQRLWTLQAPPGWRSVRTVAARRALDDRSRELLLRYRRPA